jgi:hypothetical protein
MGISPRIPSIVLRTCKPKPTDHARETFKGLANTRTVSPSVHSRSSSEGSVSFFLASALSCSPTDLATSRWRRRAMRPTDLCHPNDLRAPAPRELPASHHTFAWGAPRRVLGSARYDWGIERFTAARFSASADRHSNTSRFGSSYSLISRSFMRHESSAFYSDGVDAIEPLTFLS